MLGYAFRVVMNLIQNRTYRGELLRTLVKLYRGLTTPDYVQMCQCLIFLDEPMAVADILGIYCLCIISSKLIITLVGDEIFLASNIIAGDIFQLQDK